MSDKQDFINGYFESWDERLDRAVKLIDSQYYYEEGLLVLSCYIGAFAAMRYPGIKDGGAYTKIVLEYSGMGEFYHEIDLLFLYQRPRSKLSENGSYKALKNYNEIVELLKGVYGEEEAVRGKNRYVAPEKLIKQVSNTNMHSFDEENFRQKLPLFSRSELLYRYLRCDFIHNASFLFAYSNNGMFELCWITTMVILLYQKSVCSRVQKR